MKDYIKAAVANRLVLAAYTGLAIGWGGIGAIGIIYDAQDAHSTEFLVAAGVTTSISVFSGALLGLTGLGVGTVSYYKGMRERLERKGRIHPRLVSYMQEKPYCMKVGANLAIKEAGLEHLLEESRRTNKRNCCLLE